MHALALVMLVGCIEGEELVAGEQALEGGASLVFGGDWSLQQVGEIVGGGSVEVDYDYEARLPDCRGRKYGQPAWGMVVNWRFDGGPVQQASLTQNHLPGPPPVIAVPVGARELEMWFLNSDVWGCRGWDSQYGANYRFGVK